MPVILSIDPSIRHIGICVLSNGKIKYTACLKPPRNLKNETVLVHIFSEVKNLIEKHTPDFVAIEGYSYGSVGRVYQLGEVGGVLRLLCAQFEIPVIIVSPSQAKKYTGNGRADKKEILNYVRKTEKISIDNNDIADAIVIARSVESAFTYLEKGTVPKFRKAAEVTVALAKNIKEIQ